MEKEPVIDFVLSQRGQRMLVVNAFKFKRRTHLKNGLTYWICSVEGCKAKCYTRDDKLCDYTLGHNHNADVQKLSRQAVSNVCKKKAVTDVCERPSKIIDTMLAGSLYTQNLTARDLGFIRHNINRNRLNVKLSPPEYVEVQKTGPSTSTSYSRNETNESTYSITDEDSTAEDMYQDDGDGDGDIEGDVEGDGEGEVDEKKTDLLDISDTRILQDAVEPLRVEVDRELPSPGECELFGEYIARHLQNLPISVALKLQSGIHNLVMQTRLEYIRDHPSEAPAMVKQEPLLEENEEEDSRPPNTETPTNQPVSDKPVQIRPEKRPPNTDPPEPKRFKPDSSRSETQKSSASTTHGQQKKRTDCAVFAEHIALQLEQLPEEISLQLQSDIYALITQACPKPADEGAPPHRVKIKAETVDAMPIELINEYYDNV